MQGPGARGVDPVRHRCARAFVIFPFLIQSGVVAGPSLLRSDVHNGGASIFLPAPTLPRRRLSAHLRRRREDARILVPRRLCEEHVAGGGPREGELAHQEARRPVPPAPRRRRPDARGGQKNRRPDRCAPSRWDTVSHAHCLFLVSSAPTPARPEPCCSRAAVAAEVLSSTSSDAHHPKLNPRLSMRCARCSSSLRGWAVPCRLPRHPPFRRPASLTPQPRHPTSSHSPLEFDSANKVMASVFAQAVLDTRPGKPPKTKAAVGGERGAAPVAAGGADNGDSAGAGEAPAEQARAGARDRRAERGKQILARDALVPLVTGDDGHPTGRALGGSDNLVQLRRALVARSGTVRYRTTHCLTGSPAWRAVGAPPSPAPPPPAPAGRWGHRPRGRRPDPD